MDRFSLTYKEWRDDAIADPEAYGLEDGDVRQMIAERDEENESEPCERCLGQGYDLDQSNPTEEQVMNGDPRPCYDCNGCGRIYHPWSRYEA